MTEKLKIKHKSSIPFGRIGQIIGVIILIALLFKMFGGSTFETSKSLNSDVQESKTDSKVEESQKQTLYQINDPVVVDYLTYTVTKAERFKEMGTPFMDKKTEGTFIKIYIKIVNNAKETKNLFSPRFVLIDDKGRNFDRLSDDYFYINDAIEFGKQLQPGLGTSGAIVFEVPEDFNGLTLAITGDWKSTSEARIGITTLYDIGKDLTMQKEQDKIMEQAMAEGQKQMEELMNQCNYPFSCKSYCSEYLNVGQKNCPSGTICCMDEN